MSDELRDRQEIRDLMARYARGVDRMDWELVRSCYHPEATDDHGAYAGGVDGFIDFLASDQVLPGFECTMHTMANQNVDLDGDRAHAETYCVAYHRCTDRHPWGRADVTIHRFLPVARRVAREPRRSSSLRRGTGQRCRGRQWPRHLLSGRGARADAQINLPHLLVLFQFRCGAFQRDSSGLQHIGIVGNTQRQRDRLFRQ